MAKSVLATQTEHAQSHVLDSSTGCLTMDQVSIGQSVLKQGSHRVDVVFAHFTDVFEQERKRFEDTILHVEFWNSVLVHESRKHRERSAGFGHDGNSDGGTNSVLSFLDLVCFEEQSKGE